MDERIEELISRSSELQEKDISNSDLGVQNDFSDANQIKNEVCEYQLKILNHLGSISELIPDVTQNKYLNQIQKQLDGFDNQIKSIDQLVEGGIHNQNFPKQRDQKIEQFRNIQDSYKEQLFEIEKVIKLFKHEELINDSEFLDQAIIEAKKKISEINKEYEDAKSTLGDIRDLSMVKSLKESAGTFEKLRSNHSGDEKTWRNVFWGALISTLIAIIVIVSIDFDTSSVATVIGDSIRKLLIISVPALLTKVSLKKYNLERNLKIIYDHRATVLKQYKNFENAIGDDQEAKNSFRLEIAKYIFSDPQTGYIGDGKSNEVSVNPIINLAERMASRS